MSQDVSQLMAAWSVLEPILTLNTEDDYWQRVEELNVLLDIVDNDESHPLFGLLNVLKTLVEAYENQLVKAPDLDGVELLAHLMDEFELEAADLIEVGSVEEVEGILTRRKELTTKQIKALGERFHISPAAFLR